jgi:ADP-ribosylglycohydrolase
MALSIVALLLDRGAVDQDELARRFADRMQASRGYGLGAYKILAGIKAGQSWASLTRSGFGGMGSFGNGAAMRVAPLGAFFADRDQALVTEQARLSAEITHAHPEGIAGAIAVAVAAALAWRARGTSSPLGRELIERVRDATPAGYTRDAIGEALALSSGATVMEAAAALGNGSGVTAPDTVPFCLWIASRYSHDYVEAMWNTVSALGDCDTTCAIVGGIVVCQTGRTSIPEDWFDCREPVEV